MSIRMGGMDEPGSRCDSSSTAKNGPVGSPAWKAHDVEQFESVVHAQLAHLRRVGRTQADVLTGRAEARAQRIRNPVPETSNPIPQSTQVSSITGDETTLVDGTAALSNTSDVEVRGARPEPARRRRRALLAVAAAAVIALTAGGLGLSAKGGESTAKVSTTKTTQPLTTTPLPSVVNTTVPSEPFNEPASPAPSAAGSRLPAAQSVPVGPRTGGSASSSAPVPANGSPSPPPQPAPPSPSPPPPAPSTNPNPFCQVTPELCP